MADSDENEVSAEDPHKRLLKQLKLSKMLLIISAVVSTVIICIMATGMTVMFMRIAELTPPTEELVERRVNELNEELTRINDFRRKELLVIMDLRDKLEAVRTDDSAEIVTKISSALNQREADFQKLIKTTVSGTSDLANMIRGNRDWTKEHHAQLEGLLAASKERQQTFGQLSQTPATENGE
jgi:hypothetical protein